MSWQAYVDQSLLASGKVQRGGIYDGAGNPWAYSPGFAAQINEVHTVSSSMAQNDNCGYLVSSGVRVEGVKYMFVRGDEKFVYAKNGASGVVFVKGSTGNCTFVVVGYHDGSVSSGECETVVTNLVQHISRAS